MKNKSVFRLPPAVALLFSVNVLMSAPLATFPGEGRWSVATDWANGWPEDWHHVQVSRSSQVGEWSIYEGDLSLPAGVLKLRDSSRVVDQGTGLTEVRRRWDWTGTQPLEKVTLSIRVSVQGMKEGRPFLPGISYYDNPAGQSVDPTRIPVIRAAQGKRRGFYEEHRFPMTFAAVEGEVGDQLTIAALHSIPSPVPGGNRPDQWWSLGLEYLDTGIELALYSGAVASNGQDSIIKGHQKKFHEYENAWITLRPDSTVEKTFFIESREVGQRGSGFQLPLWTAITLANPFNPDGFPPLRDVIERKFADTLERWREGPGYAGIKAFPAERRWIDLAWAGQSEAYAYPFLQLGGIFDLPDVEAYVQKGLDFITTSPITKDGFSIRYDMEKHEWLDRRNPLSQGQAINNLLDALRLAGKTKGLVDTSKWQRFLKQACNHHASQVLASNWKPVSTNQGFLIAPLAKASGLFDNPRYLQAAVKAGEHYMKRHLSMDEPYWGGTLDARCEDKEGAWAAFQGFMALYEVTGKQAYLDAAIHAGDVVLSYVYLWDVDLPPGRLTDHAFKTRGWTSVSVQNMHLDVYGVLCTPGFWKLGNYTGNDAYHKLARLMLVACGQLLDPLGSQGEQMHQTNYAQHYDYESLQDVRGDYVEQWNVYWISAHFLVAASQLDELGVEWEKW